MQVVEVLIRAGAAVNQAHNDGFTPLYVASRQVSSKTVVACKTVVSCLGII